MIFKSNAQRRAVMANLFSRDSPFSVSAFAIRQKGCNRFSDSVDYATGEGLSAAEMATLQKQTMTPELGREYMENRRDVQERERIQQKGLGALASIPSMLPEDAGGVASTIIGPYVKAQSAKLREKSAADIYRPLYIDALKRQTLAQDRSIEKGIMDIEMQKEKLKQERIKTQAYETFGAQGFKGGFNGGPQYGEIRFKRK